MPYKPWKAKGTVVSWATRPVGTHAAQPSSAPPPRRAPPRPDPPVVYVSGFWTRQFYSTFRRKQKRNHHRIRARTRTYLHARIPRFRKTLYLQRIRLFSYDLPCFVVDRQTTNAHLFLLFEPNSRTCLACERLTATNTRRSTGQQPGTKIARGPADKPICTARLPSVVFFPYALYLACRLFVLSEIRQEQFSPVPKTVR